MRRKIRNKPIIKEPPVDVETVCLLSTLVKCRSYETVKIKKIKKLILVLALDSSVTSSTHSENDLVYNNIMNAIDW